jgi:hypothetical protein
MQHSAAQKSLQLPGIIDLFLLKKDDFRKKVLTAVSGGGHLI